MGLLDKISQATGMPKKKVLQAALGFMLLFIVFGVGSSLLTNLIGVAYPIFMSFHALESVGEDDDKQWLTYWVIFGIFNIVDQFAGFILRFIPFYYVLKVVVLIVLFHPQTLGATFVYKEYVQPFWKQYGPQFESLEARVEKGAKEFEQKAQDMKNKAKEQLSGKTE